MRLAKPSKFIPVQNVVYFVTLPFMVLKIFTFYINDVLLFKCPFPEPKGSAKCNWVHNLLLTIASFIIKNFKIYFHLQLHFFIVC